VNRVKLLFIPGLEVEFVNRDRGIKQIIEWSVKSTRFPIVVFGPEGCGKTAWLKQAALVLRDLGFETIYVDPLRRDYISYTSVRDIVKKFAETVIETIGVVEFKLATLAVDVIKELIGKWKKKKIAILIDDVFQAIGLDKAEIYVKSLLGLIEYPPEVYENIVVIVTTSEGVSRWRIGRHRWADVVAMWNMSKRGFKELYEKTPKPKPEFEDVWRLTGGNPEALKKLYQSSWCVNAVIEKLINAKRLKHFVVALTSSEREWLFEAINDPDTLFTRERIQLVNKLVELNLIVDTLPSRNSLSWLDEPPPEKDLELGIGRNIAWQTPLHREAIKKALEEA